VLTPAATDISGNMARTHAIALLGAVCLLVAGCGSSASSTPEYVAAGNAICAEQLAQFNRLPLPATPEQAVSYLPQALAIMQRETGRLAALDLPASKRAQFQAGLASSRQLATLLHGVLHKLRSGVVEISAFAQVQAQSATLKADIDAHLRQAGLARCAQ
jgi:hypothetical protein